MHNRYRFRPRWDQTFNAMFKVTGYKQSIAPLRLLVDAFYTADAADLTTPRTAEPGPGTRTVTQPDSVFSISGAALNLDLAVAATMTNNNVKYSDVAITDAAGVIVKANVTLDTTGTTRFVIQLVDSGDTERRTGIMFGATAGLVVNNNVNSTVKVTDWVYGDATYDVAFAYVASDLVAMLLKTGSDWVVRHLHPVQGSTSTNYLQIAVREADNTQLINDVDAALLDGDWSTDHAVLTDFVSGALTDTDTFECNADSTMGFSMPAVGTTGTTRITYRWDSDNQNGYSVGCLSNGNVILQRYDSGVLTNLATAGSGSVVDGDYINIATNDETIEIFTDETEIISYSGASAYKTQTGGIVESIAVDATPADLAVAPYTLTGINAARVEAV